MKTEGAIMRFREEFHFLSNFDMQYPFLYRRWVWTSAEAAFQAEKTTSLKWRAQIHGSSDPKYAKKLGRQAPLIEDWEDVKNDRMKLVLLAKFKVPTYAEMLIDTGERYLMEGNNWGDTYWGRVKWGDDWIGSNWLGRLLMEVRKEIQ